MDTALWRRGALVALVAASAAATLALRADPAFAAYTAHVQAGTLEIAGNAASDKLALRLEAGSPSTLELDVGEDGTADFSFDRTTFTAIVVNAGGGDDELRIDQSGGPFTDEAVTLNGGDGDDTLLGGDGADLLLGGKGDDLADGNRGTDQAFLGSGNDRFQWDPGDGSDTAEGQAGSDQLDFNGSNIGEKIEIAANADRVRLTRDVGAINMDLDTIETINVRALGGADTITVDDLTATDTKTVNTDLDATLGGPDNTPDTVIVNGTDRRDRVQVTRSGGEVSVAGLAAEVRIVGSEPALDTLLVKTFAGDDDVSVAPDVSGLIDPTVDLGADE